jgi:hypothetical protein
VSLGALADRIASGSFSARFPEGHSHDAPYLKEIKTGAARTYYQARMRIDGDGPPPALVPVGLHYAQKRLFRSNALVVFHPPITLPEQLDVTPAMDEDPERLRELARGLTQEVERDLKAAILETESWEFHGLFHRARKLIRAERAFRAETNPGATTMDERVLGLARLWTSYQQLIGTDPERVAELPKRVQRYDRMMRALAIEDHEIDHPSTVIVGWLVVGLVLQVVSVVVLLPPFLLIGALVNLPPALVVIAGARAASKEPKDEATTKLIAGALVFPGVWAVWAWLAGWGTVQAQAIAPWVPDQPIVVVAVMVALCVASAIVMLLYWELAVGTLRALRVRLTRGRHARVLTRLRAERSRLCDELVAFAEGVELPGLVLPSGRLSRGR